MGRKHRIRVTPEELERYERSLVKPKGRETPLASTSQALEYLGPLKLGRRIRAPSAERRRPRKERPMTPRTAARRGRLVASKSPMREAGSRGYLCEVPSSDKGQRIVARRRAAAQKDLPGFDSSRRQAARTLSATGRRRSSAAGRSRAPLWATSQRPSSAAANMQSVSAAPLWDRATLPPAPSTCSLRPQRSMINEADREARLALRASAEASSREQLLATMASDPRPFTAPAARTRRSHASPKRSPRTSPRASSVDGSSPEREREQTHAEDAAVQTPVMELGHHAEHSALILEIIRAEGVGRTANGDDAELADPVDAEEMKSYCRVSLEGSTWHTPFVHGSDPEWRHQKTTFVADSASCIVLDVLSSPSEDTHDLMDGGKHHCHVGIRVSSLTKGLSEQWYRLLPYTGECTPDAGAGDAAAAPEGEPRVLLRTQFAPRAAEAQEEQPAMHKQLHEHHSALLAASDTAAGQLSVTVLAGRNLGANSSKEGGESTPQDSFAVVEYNGVKTHPSEVTFGVSQPQWDMKAGPFSVAVAENAQDHGPPLVVRVHKWRNLRNSQARSAAYELHGAVAIDVRHAIHKWSRSAQVGPRDPAVTVVEAWVGLYTWAAPDKAALFGHGVGASARGTHWHSHWHNPHRRLHPCGEVLVRLSFEQSAFVRVERPLPYHTTLQVTLCQCHRLTGDLQSSVRIELSLHRNQHLATRKPPFPNSVETWSSRTVDEMFSPTFFESFSFTLLGCNCVLRLDVYEITTDKTKETSVRRGSPSRQTAKKLSDIDSLDAMNASTGSQQLQSSPNGSSRAPKIKQKLVCSAVVPFMRLISTHAAHWYNLLPEIKQDHDDMHSRNVDSLLDPLNVKMAKHQDKMKAMLPHGAVQFSAKLNSGNEKPVAADVEVTSSHVHSHKTVQRHHARVTIQRISVEGLPRVQATGRTGVGTSKLIEPSPFVRFAFGEHARQTTAQKRAFEASWDNEVLHLPFSWLDDGDGDPEPEELEAEMKMHGGLTCRVYHRAGPNATEREQLIGTVTLSLIELISKGGHGVSPGPRTYTIFNTTGHSVRQLKAKGRITIEATVEFEGQDELGAGEHWEDSDEEDPEGGAERGNHHLGQPNTQLHYMLKTADSLRRLPVVALEPELLALPTPDSDASEEVPAHAAVTSLNLTVHSMQHIPERVTRPVCRVYVASTTTPKASPIGSPNGSSTGGSHHQLLMSPSLSSSPLSGGLTSSAEDNAFLISPEVEGQLTVEKNITFNLPRKFLDQSGSEEEDESAEASEPKELPEDRVLMVEVFENLGKPESEVVLGELFGRVSLPVAQAAELQAEGQQWHPLNSAGAVSFAATEGGAEQGQQQSLEIPAVQLTVTASTASELLAPHVICAATRLPPPPKSDELDEVTAATQTGEGDSASQNRLGHNSDYHNAKQNVRIFYDTTNLESLDDANEIEAVLLEAKETWSRHHHFDYQVDELGPIVMEVFGKFKRDDLSEEWETKAEENMMQWIELYKDGQLMEWTFKNFCAFWRQVVDDTVKYAIRLGEAFRDFYCRSMASDRFAELDTDGSGSLEGDERDAMISWILR
jgi:hypothetical protein